MILLVLFKEHVIESDKLELEVREVFGMLDVALVAVEMAVAVLTAVWFFF